MSYICGYVLPSKCSSQSKGHGEASRDEVPVLEGSRWRAGVWLAHPLSPSYEMIVPGLASNRRLNSSERIDEVALQQRIHNERD